MLVFDKNIERQDAPVATPKDTSFGYLNRSNRVEAGKVRDLIESWAARYPASHRAKLINDLRQFDDDRFTSAFWELALHEWLLRTGNTILAIEPEIPCSATRPDFLVQAPDGSRFYLEAVVATGRSDAELSERRRMADVWQALDQVQLPNHFLSVHHLGMPTENVPTAKMKKLLQEWCNSLPEGAAAESVAPFEYEHRGLQLRITALAREKSSSRPSRPVAITLLPVHSSTPGEAVLRALQSKARKYGTLPTPFVIAVNALGTYADRFEVVDALFGHKTLTITKYGDGRQEERWARTGEGLWGHAGNPRASRVSAVLATERFHPWSIGQRRARLVRNPWAANVLPDIASRIDEMNPGEDAMQESTGEAWHQIFDLNDGWPEETNPDTEWTDVSMS